jgi:hypothetical protein
VAEARRFKVHNNGRGWHVVGSGPEGTRGERIEVVEARAHEALEAALERIAGDDPLLAKIAREAFRGEGEAQ